MIKQAITVILVIFLSATVFSADSGKYSVPDVTIEALKNGSFRAYIPDSQNLKFFAFHARINQPIPMSDPGDYSMEATEKTGDFWIVSFPHANVKIGDRIYYWIFFHVNRLGYGRDSLNTTISDVLNAYPSLKARCIKAVTTLNGQETCVGATILSDQFEGSTINDRTWLMENWIPTYTAPSYIFNSYLNKDETRFILNGILHLKPIAIQSETEVRGVLDLKNGCTSKVNTECYFKSQSWYLLPPVQSAKITSKTSFKYGKIDVRAKLPAGDWLAPVIRLEQKNKEDGENSPVVWIVFSRGNEHFNGEGSDVGASVVYSGPVLNQVDPGRSIYLISNRSLFPFYRKFYTYSLEWKPGKMTFSIDNTEYGSVDLTKRLGADIDIRNSWTASEAPFNTEYVLSLGVAVGGLTDFPDGYTSGNTEKPWKNNEPKFIRNFFDQRSVWSSTWKDNSAALQVDYVTVTAV